MDRNGKILIALCFVLIVLWGPVSNMIWPPKPLPPSARTAPAGTNDVSRTASVRQAQVSSHAPTPQPAPLVARLQEEAAAQDASAILENDDMAVHFTAQGGGIAKVVFKKFDVAGEPPATINNHTPTATLDVAHLGGLEFGGEYKLDVRAAEGRVVARKSTSQVEVTKTFSLKDRYQLQAEVRIVNRTDKEMVSVNEPVEVVSIVENGGEKTTEIRLVKPAAVVIGTANPLTHLDSGSDLAFEWLSSEDKHSTGGLYSVTSSTWYAFWQKPLYMAFYKEFPAPEGQAAPDEDPTQWVAVRNQFFTLIVSPENHRFAGVRADGVPLPLNELPYSRKDQKAIFVYADVAGLHVPAGGEQMLSYNIYAGPREYKLLAALGKQRELIMSYGWWTAFCKGLLWLMTLFHGWVGNWGVAIIAMTVVIKLVFWPLTNASTRSMKRMQALAPRLKELQEKYKDDMEKRNMETMKLYREYGVNPVGGCLPMIVQIPIFIALFTMLRSMVQLRGSEFLWIKDLSMPDTVARIPFPEFQFLWWDMGPIPINPMPILMTIANIWQMKLTPTTATDKSQKMMMWAMPFFFFFICYNFSSALALYWTCQTLLQAAQTKLIKTDPAVKPEKVKRPQATGFSFARPVEAKKKKK